MAHISKEELLAGSGHYMWRFLYRRLDYLRLHFLLERLLVERGHESKQTLLDVSREMVDLTVFLWLQRDRAISRHFDFDYLVSTPDSRSTCDIILRSHPDNVLRHALSWNPVHSAHQTDSPAQYSTLR